MNIYVLITYSLSGCTLLGYALFMQWHYYKQCKPNDVNE